MRTKRRNMEISLQLFGGRGVSSGKNYRNYYLNKMKNPKAKNVIDQLYRPGAKCGDGGTADALKQESRTGQKVEGKRHYQKAKERLKNITNVLNKENLTKMERDILELMYKKLMEAIEEWEQRN